MIHLRQIAGRARAPVKQYSIVAGLFSCAVSRPRQCVTHNVQLISAQRTPSLERHVSGLSNLRTRQGTHSFTCRTVLLPKTQIRTAFRHEGPEPRRRKAVPVFDDPRDDPRIRDAEPLVTPEQISRFYRSPRLHTVVVVCFLAAIAFYYANIETVPVSGRKRFNCHSDKTVRELSEQQFEVLMNEFRHAGVRFLPLWDARSRMVKRVMDRLKPVSGMDDIEWDFFVIDDPGNANAFVLPCGKVFVFSGIFRHAHTEDALAAVLGHEIAHNLASHAAEQMSASIGTNVLFWSVAILTFGLFTIPVMYGAGVLKFLFESPMSRMQETEADQIGLLMMAEACYDPRQAIPFWRSMQQYQGLHEPPEWLSTHPSHQSRIENIQKMLPLALEKREQSDCRGTQGFAESFKRAMRRGEIITLYPTRYV